MFSNIGFFAFKLKKDSQRKTCCVARQFRLKAHIYSFLYINNMIGGNTPGEFLKKERD